MSSLTHVCLAVHGLFGEQTLAQIGEELKLSRERVRQIETRALLKLRQPQRRSKVRDYIQGLDS